jgi:hypothetical protein
MDADPGHPYTSMLVVTVEEDVEAWPGQYVARRQWLHRDGQRTLEMDPIGVATDLGALHPQIPSGLVRVPRGPDDPPQVVETWI